MTRESLVFVLGLLVLLVPRFGIPTEWKEYFLLGAGILLMLIGYGLRRAAYIRSIENDQGELATESYVESVPDIDTDYYYETEKV